MPKESFNAMVNPGTFPEIHGSVWLGYAPTVLANTGTGLLSVHSLSMDWPRAYVRQELSSGLRPSNLSLINSNSADMVFKDSGIHWIADVWRFDCASSGLSPTGLATIPIVKHDTNAATPNLTMTTHVSNGSSLRNQSAAPVLLLRMHRQAMTEAQNFYGAQSGTNFMGVVMNARISGGQSLDLITAAKFNKNGSRSGEGLVLRPKEGLAVHVVEAFAGWTMEVVARDIANKTYTWYMNDSNALSVLGSYNDNSQFNVTIFNSSTVASGTWYEIVAIRLLPKGHMRTGSNSAGTYSNFLSGSIHLASLSALGTRTQSFNVSANSHDSNNSLASQFSILRDVVFDGPDTGFRENISDGQLPSKVNGAGNESNIFQFARAANTYVRNHKYGNHRMIRWFLGNPVMNAGWLTNFASAPTFANWTIDSQIRLLSFNKSDKLSLRPGECLAVFMPTFPLNQSAWSAMKQGYDNFPGADQRDAYGTPTEWSHAFINNGLIGWTTFTWRFTYETVAATSRAFITHPGMAGNING